MRILVLIVGIMISVFIQAQDSSTVQKKTINTQSMLFVNTDKQQQDSTQFKVPKFKQGFFCNFEDQLNRKKVPIDFSLGKSKY